MVADMRLFRGLTAVAAALLLLSFAGCSADTSAEPDPAAPVGAIPAFTAVTLDGGEFTSAELEGKPSVLWFWAPWCSTCRAEAPDIASAAAQLQGDVEIIGVGALGPVVDMDTFVQDTGLTGMRHVSDENAEVWADFGVAAQPAFAFISANGSIEIVQGSLDTEQIVERARGLS